MSEIFDSTNLDKLIRKQEIRKNNVIISLESEVTIKNYLIYEVVLAIHASPELIKKIDNNQSVSHLIFLTEKRDVEENWLNKVRPKFLGPA